MIHPIAQDGYIDIVNHSYSLQSGPAGVGGRELDGDVRCHDGNLQVYNYGTWTTIGNDSFEVKLSPIALRIMDWANKKMLEETRLDELCKKYPALEHAKDRYEIIKAMVENDK
jgi:hypothetical protein